MRKNKYVSELRNEARKKHLLLTGRMEFFYPFRDFGRIFTFDLRSGNLEIYNASLERTKNFILLAKEHPDFEGKYIFEELLALMARHSDLDEQNQNYRGRVFWYKKGAMNTGPVASEWTTLEHWLRHNGLMIR